MGSQPAKPLPAKLQQSSHALTKLGKDIYVLTELDDENRRHRVITWTLRSAVDSSITTKPCRCDKHSAYYGWPEGREIIAQHAQKEIMPIITDNLQAHLPSVLCDLVLDYVPMLIVGY